MQRERVVQRRAPRRASSSPRRAAARSRAEPPTSRPGRDGSPSRSWRFSCVWRCAPDGRVPLRVCQPSRPWPVIVTVRRPGTPPLRGTDVVIPGLEPERAVVVGRISPLARSRGTVAPDRGVSDIVLFLVLAGLADGLASKERRYARARLAPTTWFPHFPPAPWRRGRNGNSAIRVGDATSGVGRPHARRSEPRGRDSRSLRDLIRRCGATRCRRPWPRSWPRPRRCAR